MNLLPLNPEAQAHAALVQAAIRAAIVDSDHWIPFSRFMDLALYAPGLGYYVAGMRKFGAAGDFVTAPEISPLFANALAVQGAEIMQHSEQNVIEVGAGSGRLAADLLVAWEKMGCLPKQYAILDVSPDLKERQKQTIQRTVPHLASQVVWLDRIPDQCAGLILGNELLDAMPVELLALTPDGLMRRGVSVSDEGVLQYADRPAAGDLKVRAEEMVRECGLSPDYLIELPLAGRSWVTEWAKRLTQGAILLFDYGFPRHEYYHPDRHAGTLMCHYRHHAHTEPLHQPGMEDITAHVDFTAVAEAAFAEGLSVLGYTAQSHFLLNCGILDLAQQATEDAAKIARQSVALNKLLSPAEMGELFKVIAVGKGIPEPLIGFKRHDRTHSL